MGLFKGVSAQGIITSVLGLTVLTACGMDGSGTSKRKTTTTNTLNETNESDSPRITSASTAILPEGKVTLRVTGGKAPYSFRVLEGGGDLVGATYTAAKEEGQVTIRVTDQQSRSSTWTTKIETPSSINVAFSEQSIRVNQTMVITPSGGKAPYRYAVLRGLGSINASGVYSGSSTPTAVSAQVTDADGNSKFFSFQVYESQFFETCRTALAPGPEGVSMRGTPEVFLGEEVCRFKVKYTKNATTGELEQDKADIACPAGWAIKRDPDAPNSGTALSISLKRTINEKYPDRTQTPLVVGTRPVSTGEHTLFTYGFQECRENVIITAEIRGSGLTSVFVPLSTRTICALVTDIGCVK